MPESQIVRTKDIDRAASQAGLELLQLADFYKRHNKLQQASEVERAIAQFTTKKIRTFKKYVA